MVKCKSTTRFSSVKVSIILTQTDTTVGFLSQNAKKLYEIKERKPTKPFIQVYNNFKKLNTSTCRVPNEHKNLVRRSKKTTFIIKGNSFRVSSSSLDSQILKNLDWVYSTSANKSQENFCREFCEDKADIIIENNNRLKENVSSKLIKLNYKRRKKLR